MLSLSRGLARRVRSGLRLLVEGWWKACRMGWRTIWFSLFAAPRPVGPAPITRTSTFLFLLVELLNKIIQLTILSTS